MERSMMKWISHGAVFVLGMVLATATLARPEQRTPADHRTKDALVDRVMTLSGIDRQFDRIPELIEAQIHRQPPPIGVAETARLVRVLTSAFSPDKTRRTMRDYLIDHFDERRFAQLATMLESPLARRMTALEDAASTQASLQRLMQEANRFMADLSPERLILLGELDRSMGMSETMVEFQVRAFEAIVQALSPLLPEGQRMPEDRMEAIADQMREQGLYPTRQQNLVQLAWTYREASDREIEDYLALYRSDIGQRSTRLMKAATMAVFDRAMTEIARALSQELERSRGV